MSCYTGTLAEALPMKLDSPSFITAVATLPLASSVRSLFKAEKKLSTEGAA